MLPRQVEEGPVRADARIGDHDVDPAESLGRRIAEADEGVEIPDVTGLSHDVVEPEVVAASGSETEPDPALVQEARRCGSDAAARTRDHCDLALQFHCVSVHLSGIALDFGAPEREV